MVSSPYNVALVGRTNVGKSTLFNRLAGGRRALTAAEAHLTRDRQQWPVDWNRLTFDLVDTGGLDVQQYDPLGKEVVEQAQTAVIECDLALFVLEAGIDLLPTDRLIAKTLRQSSKPVLVVLNKTDQGKKRVVPPEILGLGWGEPYFVSALSGSGTGDLLDAVVEELKKLPAKKQRKKETIGKALTIAFVGKPNVGKSSLTNALLGEPRVIVSPIPHTTRTTQQLPFRFMNQDYILVDTAGLRKQAKMKTAKVKQKSVAEAISVEQTKEAIKQADIIGLVIDSAEGLTAQDSHLAQLVTDGGKSLLIIATKWDLVPDKKPDAQNRATKQIYRHYPYLTWAPIVFTSGLTKKGVTDILTMAREIELERYKELPSTGLDRFLATQIKKHKPSRGKGTKHPRLISFKQIGVNPPTFRLLTEYLNLHPSYLRFLENQLREKFGFKGTPLRIIMKPLKN